MFIFSIGTLFLCMVIAIVLGFLIISYIVFLNVVILTSSLPLNGNIY